MTAQYTQGPWATHEDADGMACSIRSGDRTIARVVCIDSSSDARLIAAAPVLLEALRIAREHIQIDRNSFKEAHSFPDGFMEREDQATLKRLDQKLAVIDAAIAKAEAP